MRVYRVNNIFYSLQGEGRYTGCAAVFIRFAGCNLRCPFCDTDFEDYREMTAEEIIETISRYEVRSTRYEDSSPHKLIVLTGGEPTLQVDEAFIDLLHQRGYEVAMESNGTRPAPKNLDWLTVSPKVKEEGEWRKENGERRIEKWGRQPDELKIVFDEHTDPETYLSQLLPLTSSAPSPLLYLQPCDTGDAERNKVITQACVDYIKQHPQWRLSLQTHKLINIE